jgi:hypothetical protein
MTSDPTVQAKRREATDARRLAPLFPLESDRENLLRHAKALEGEADALELQAAAEAEPDQPPDEQQQGEPQQGEQQQAEQQQADRQEPESEANAGLQAAAEPGLADQRQAEQQPQSGAADGDQGPPPAPKPG